MKSFIQILRLLKNYKPQIAANVFFNILSTIFSIFSLTAVAPFLTILFAPDEIELPATAPVFSLSSSEFLGYINYQFALFIDTYGKDQALIYFCIFIVVVFFLKNITNYFTLYFIAPVRIGVVRDLREAMHRKMLFLHLGYYNDERKGDLISRASSDVNEVENSIISSLEMVFRDPILIIAYLSTMIVMNWKLTIFVFILLPLSGIFISKIGKSLKGASNQGQSKLGEVMSVFEESLSGMRIIQAFNAQDNIQKRFDTTNSAYHRLMVKLYRKQYLASPLTEILSAFTLAILIYYGGMLVFEASEDGFTGAFFVTFIVIFSQIITPAKSFSQAYFKIQKGIASVERINKVLHAEELIQEPKNPVHLKEFKGDLRFENIRFKYGNNEVISGINLDIKKGEKIALVGPSGGGKSTIANLVPRFYDVTEGRISIDGVNIREIPLKELRGLFGIVTQESILFNDTIANKIRLSRPEATDAEVYEAAKIANAYDF